MTREEAIQILSDLQDGSGQTYEAIRMAIEALSVYTYTEQSDLISRADAMSKCKNAENELTDEADRKGVRVARFIIGELPSADRPSGEWIKRGTKITCSNCKSAWSTSFDTIIVGMRYCPSCGARMENKK